jgi:myo-inositol-1(or 4)-monophosphatase
VPNDTAGPLLEVARACCQEAAALLRQRAGERPVVRAKSAHERVTDADIEVETLLRKTLRAAVPDSAVVGEELPDEPGQAVTWYVDPIDGTHNFLRGLPLACVSVGVAVGGRLVGGCVHDLFRDESFTGGEGVPLLINGAAPPSPPPAAALPLALTDIPLTGRAGPDEPAFALDLLARADTRRIYSTALSLAWVAAGRADLACNLHIHPWDVAAGAALVRSAGGAYTPVGGQDPATAPGFVATRTRPDAATRDLERWTLARLAALAAQPSSR